MAILIGGSGPGILTREMVSRTPVGTTGLMSRAVSGLVLICALLAGIDEAAAKQCPGLVAHLEGRAEVPHGPNGRVVNESVILMHKAGSGPGIYGSWVATRTIDTQTFPGAVPDLPPGDYGHGYVSGGTSLNCLSTKPSPSRYRHQCDGQIPFKVTRQGIFMGESFRVGKVRGRTLEFSMIPGARHWPVVRGEAMRADRISFSAGLRASSDTTGRARYRLVLKASVSPKKFMPHLKITHRLERVARDSGVKLRVSGPEPSEDGSSVTMVFDFLGVSRPNDAIQSALIGLKVDFGDCTRERQLSVAELLLL